MRALTFTQTSVGHAAGAAETARQVDLPEAALPEQPADPVGVAGFADW